ncbi:M55 family metallopeptidase [Pseudomonadota bacterium]
MKLINKKQNQNIQPKVWLYVDMEGINNISLWNQVNPACKEYAKNTKKLTKEVNAAIKGFCDGGVEEVKLNDLHWFYDNLIIKKLHKKAFPNIGPSLNIPKFFKEDFDVVGVVGMHAMAGTKNAILAHTWYLPSYIESIKHDGKFIGEIGMIKFLAEEKGVPVIFISGDKAGCNEAQKTLPKIFTAITKEKDSNKINCLSERKSNRLVRQKSKEAILNFIQSSKKYKKAKTSNKPIEVVFATKNLTDLIEQRCKLKKLKHNRIDAITIEFRGKKFSEILLNFFSVLD